MYVASRGVTPNRLKCEILLRSIKYCKKIKNTIIKSCWFTAWESQQWVFLRCIFQVILLLYFLFSTQVSDIILSLKFKTSFLAIYVRCPSHPPLQSCIQVFMIVRRKQRILQSIQLYETFCVMKWEASECINLLPIYKGWLVGRREMTELWVK